MLVDRYVEGKELEVDAVCDGTDVFIPGIMEHVERTGVHSGDSISVYPTFSVSGAACRTIVDYTVKLGLGIGIKGPFNIQFIVDPQEKVHVIEVNPRSSRTVPFLSKATGINLAGVAARVALGQSLREQGYETGVAPRRDRWYVKCPVFSFSKSGARRLFSPEMKSTGERSMRQSSTAPSTAPKAAGQRVSITDRPFTIADRDKECRCPTPDGSTSCFNIEHAGHRQLLKRHGPDPPAPQDQEGSGRSPTACAPGM
ncbi:MAG: ATP-grasp domain-containing protein [Anaerotruncus massiliensis (ex Togo et al. 2019)]